MRPMSRTEGKYYMEYEVKGIPCWLSNDGFTFIFAIESIKSILDTYEYDSDEDAYWWNSSHDRYIAEHYRTGMVSVSPSFIKNL